MRSYSEGVPEAEEGLHRIAPAGAQLGEPQCSSHSHPAPDGLCTALRRSSLGSSRQSAMRYCSAWQSVPEGKSVPPLSHGGGAVGSERSAGLTRGQGLRFTCLESLGGREGSYPARPSGGEAAAGRAPV